MFVKLLTNRRRGGEEGMGQDRVYCFLVKGCKIGGDWSTEFCHGPGQCTVYQGLFLWEWEELGMLSITEGLGANVGETVPMSFQAKLAFLSGLDARFRSRACCRPYCVPSSR